MPVLGEFSNGPIQFNNDTGGIEQRGTYDGPDPDPSGVVPDNGDLLPDSKSGVAPPSSNGFLSMGSAAGGGGMGGGWVLPPAGPATATATPTTPSRDPLRAIGGDDGSGMGGHGGTDNGTGAVALGMDDGGDVPGGNDYTMDPMGGVKAALQFGRQQRGLPADFTTGEMGGDQAQGFDDGGEVGMIPEEAPEEGGEGVTAGGNIPDPRETLKYLTGDGAVSQEVAQALEQHVDPEGSMDQSTRTMAAIEKAPTPEAKFGMLQHYRTKFNAYSAAAKAALDKGDAGQAAVNATQAFANMPTGHKVEFAPAPGGGLAMRSTKLGGSTPQQEQPPQPPQQQSFDDGGEVEEEEDQQGAIPMEPATYVDPEADAQQGQEQEQDTSLQGDTPAEQAAVARVLDANKAKELLDVGYDKPLDQGWESVVDGLLSSVGPSSAQAAPAAKVPAPTPKVLSNPSNTATAQLTPDGAAPDATAAPVDPGTRQITQPGAGQGKDKAQEEKEKQAFERIQQTAEKIFPWASQGDQRSAYMQKAMEHYQDTEGKIAVGQQSGKQEMERIKELGRNDRALQANQGRDQRQSAAITSKEAMFDRGLKARALTEAQRNAVRLINTQVQNDPQISKDPKKLIARVEYLAKQAGVDSGAALEALGLSAGGGGQQQQAPAQRQQQSAGDPAAAQVGETRPYTKNGVTKNYTFGRDGMWHPSPNE